MVLADRWKTCKGDSDSRHNGLLLGGLSSARTRELIFLPLLFKLFSQFVSVEGYTFEHALIPDVTNRPLLLSFPLFGNRDL